METGSLFRENVFTISNALTLSRVMIVPFVTYFMYVEEVTGNTLYRLHQSAFFILIVMSDFLDGFFARSFGQVSKLGRFLDPLADKICLLCIGSSLAYFKDFPLWLLLVWFCREIFIVAAAGYLFYRRDVEVKPNIFGKISVACMALSALIYLFSIDYTVFRSVGVKELSIVLMLVFYITGTILYVKTYSIYYNRKAV